MKHEESIGAFDAKTHLASLLERVERGESFVITRRGKSVARLIPATQVNPPPSVDVLIEAARKLRSQVRARPEEIRVWIDEGRAAAIADDAPIELEPGLGLSSTQLLLIAGTHKLSAYDAHYLELAMRRGARLLTGDADLAAAARRAGIATG